MDTNTLYRIQRAILQGQTLEEVGLSGDPEVEAAYLQIKKEMEQAPKGTMLQIVDDPPWGQFDALIDATEKAHGPFFGDKTLKEMEEERRAKIAAERERDRS